MFATETTQAHSVPIFDDGSYGSQHRAHHLNPRSPEFIPTLDPVQQINRIATALALPAPEVEKFHGDPLEYGTFILAFDTRISSRTNSSADLLYYLLQHVDGQPKELISGCTYLPTEQGYAEARMLLDHEYGDPYKVSTAYIRKLTSWPPIKSDDGSQLRGFAFYLLKCNNAMRTIEHMSVLNHAPNLQSVVLKLPAYLQNKWRDRATTIRLNEYRTAQFRDLVAFVRYASESANDPMFSKEAMSDNAQTQNAATNQLQSQPKPCNSNTSFAVNIGEETIHLAHQSKKPLQCYYCKKEHDLDDCKDFNQQSMDNKRQFLMNEKRCFSCFSFNHTSRGCLQKRTCKRCGKKHPTCMHIEGFRWEEGDKNSHQVNPTSQNIQKSPHQLNCNAINQGESTILQAVLPVRIVKKGSSKEILTYAFYDPGSSGCFLSEELRDQLAATGRNTTLQIKTMHGTSVVNTVAVDDLVVSDINGDNMVDLPTTYTQWEIPISHNQIPKPEMLHKWPYLNSVANQMAKYQPQLDVGLLIGSNCPRALEPLKVIHMEQEGPFALLYRHGWTICGPIKALVTPDNTIISCNRISMQKVQVFKEVLTPKEVLSILDRDFTDIKVARFPGERGHSQEDMNFMEKAADGISLINGHYMLPLPFRNVEPTMPNNKSQAIKRALYQKKKMLKDQTYHSDYVKFMENVLDKGYAGKIHETQLRHDKGKVWYLPHHAVYHPKKPDKIRVVFDCSARFGGISLNDQLLQGPDLTNSLIGVLMRFREHEIAFMGDIESMFYQVRVPEEQYNYLRFLWWPEGNLDAELSEYYMKVHLFGAASSPSIANYALKQIVADNKAKLQPEVACTIQRHYYVDDCLRSVSTEQQARTLIQDLTAGCSKGGFRLTKFSCNEVSVLKDIPKENLSKELKDRNLDYDPLPIEHALGIQWSVENDTFGFSVMLPNKPLTRRGILSVVSAVYDPLGFVAPFVLPAKKVLQDLCRESYSSMSWDDTIPEEYQQRFTKWLSEVPDLEAITLPRCLKPLPCTQVKSSQLHVFADASTIGYGAVAYLCLSDGNAVKSSFLMGKARLAPIKATSIPKLELTAATVAIQMGQKIIHELDIGIDNVYYHSDSTTVLHYINSEDKRFPVFVANRVRLIRDFSRPNQWRYVNTDENPADIASRGVDSSTIAKLRQWLEGPSFICKGMSEWPIQIDLQGSIPKENVDEEIVVNAVNIEKTEVNPFLQLIEYYSSWYKLKRAVVIFLWVFDFLHHKTKQEDMTLSRRHVFNVETMQRAEKKIIAHVQHIYFSAEIQALDKLKMIPDRGRAKTTQMISKCSPILRLDPILIDGVLRVGGRLSRADLPEDSKHPILLPQRSHVTTLIIRDAHQQLAHAGRNHVIAKLREQYWIVAINASVRQLIYNCIICRRIRRPCSEQKMADLPSGRLDPAPPFTCTGVDYFGPFTIKEGRKEVKRYGVLFTCLASRAIHLETANTLETDSFMNALQRFIARRGPVREIRCDNGTNFVGAERELRKAASEMNQTQIQEKLLYQNIDWSFNPPVASHMGGIWERQIRTVRKVLSTLFLDHGTRLDDECFRTLMCEVESIVNSRPITCISDNVDDYQPLSPNNILNLKPAMLPPPSHFQGEDVYLRKRWRRVQYLADLFWSRWRREYLLTLQQRTKWHKPKRNTQQGDIVLLKDDSTTRFHWPMARVTEVVADSKGVVRSVKLKTQSSTLHRPINKIVLLLAVKL